MQYQPHWRNLLWDMGCCLSVIGIWPRFIEPTLVMQSFHPIQIPFLPTQLSGLKIAHFSDLHWGEHLSDKFLARVIKKITKFKPDLIVFTGDFLCGSHLTHPNKLQSFLNQLQAPAGCYAVLGNHDYSQFVTVNEAGDYAIKEVGSHQVTRGFKRLFQRTCLTKQVDATVKNIQPHEELETLLDKTSFQLLKNECTTLHYKGSRLNICGLEEYSTGRLNCNKAFENYDKNYPGIILSHNPDSFKQLANCPGDLLLAGHTHGGQINLPFIWKRLTLMETPAYKRGLKQIADKKAYINRGLSSMMQFRWFSAPEISFFTLI